MASQERHARMVEGHRRRERAAEVGLEAPPQLHGHQGVHAEGEEALLGIERGRGVQPQHGGHARAHVGRQQLRARRGRGAFELHAQAGP